MSQNQRFFACLTIDIAVIKVMVEDGQSAKQEMRWCNWKRGVLILELGVITICLRVAYETGDIIHSWQAHW